jgi:hypothetical protein
MKYTQKILVSLLVVSILFLSCKNDEIIQSTTGGKGFVEYKYTYTLNGTAKTGYYRINLTDAAFALYDSAACYLPDTLKAQFPDIYPDSIAKKFRKVELFFYSSECNIDSIYKPLSQPLSSSMVQFTIADTLALDANPNRLLDFNYPCFLLKYMNTILNRRPTVLNWKAYMNMQPDTLSSPVVLKYKYQFQGQPNKNINIALKTNGEFIIIGNGTAISTPPSGGTTAMTYNFIYTGFVKHLKNRTAASLLIK